MGRKRSAEHDWICTLCQCPCTPPGPSGKHVGGGQGMRACKRPPRPMLRRDWEGMLAADVAAVAEILRDRRAVRRRVDVGRPGPEAS